jgi:hypothetical protein
MDSIGLYLIIIFGVIAVIIGLLGFHDYKRRSTEPLERQALKRNGTLTGGSFYLKGESPHLQFNHDGFSFDVHWIFPDEAPSFTVIDVSFESIRDYHLKIYQKSVLNKLWFFSLFDGAVFEDIQINNAFDDEFVVQGNDEAFARSLLTDKIQRKLLAYKMMRPGLRFRKGRFTIKVPLKLRNDQDYDEFIALALLFCDRLKEMGLHK